MYTIQQLRSVGDLKTLRLTAPANDVVDIASCNVTHLDSYRMWPTDELTCELPGRTTTTYVVDNFIIFINSRPMSWYGCPIVSPTSKWL